METVQEVDTVSGPLTLEKSDLWGFFRLGGQTIAQDFANHMHIVSTIPRSSKAEFVIYYIWNGGNCCEPDYFLLDAGAKPPRTLTITNWNTDAPKVLQYSRGRLELRRLAEDRTLHGDMIWETIRYQRGQQGFEVIRRSVVDNYGEFVGKPAGDLLADYKARYSLVELLGVRGFGKFHEFEEVGENLKLIANRYLTGSMMGRGRDDPWQYRMFVIDTFLDRAWAAQRDEEIESLKPPTIVAFGNLDETDMVVRALLDDWLRQFGKETAWKSGPIEIVDSALVPAPPPPTWHPRLPDTMQPY